MTLTWPLWLILVIPAALMLWLRPLPSRALTILRGVVAALLVLAACGLSINLPSRSGVVVVVADRSLSMPPGSKEQQVEAAKLLHGAMGADDRLAVVSFGQRTVVEQTPQHAPFAEFVTDVGPEASNLAEGIELALSLIPRGTPGRLLVLSDGCATGRDVATAATAAATAGVAVDYRALERPRTGDLAIERIDAPSSVGPNEAFLINAWVQSPRAQEVTYELLRGERVVARGKRPLPAGRSRMLFRDKVGDAGTGTYHLSVRPTDAASIDPVSENNTARFLVGVSGNKPLLCVSPEGSSLSKLLSAGGLKVDRRAAEQCRWSLADLSGYSAVVVEDTPSTKIGRAGMESLAAWVTQGGGNLLMTGGRNSYGTGGYFKSPLEDVLPVSMELRREHRKFSLAIVVALDRSGSMSMPVPGGRTKMDLANVATAEVLDQLSAMDQFGCFAVDEKAHEIVGLSSVNDKAGMKSKILAINSQGGGIYVYEALEKAAAMVARATAGTKHIILFSDAADSEEPGAYQALLQKITKAGITVSVIGLGTDRDPDAALLKDVAKRGGGQCSFTDDAHELPRLFAQDTFLVARSAFQEELTAIKATGGFQTVTPQSFGPLQKVGGYNLCYLRPGANLAVVTEDEYRAPLVATWQAGSGRVLSYTAQADGPFSGPMAKWPRVGDFYCSLARWVAPPNQGLGHEMLVTQDVRGGVCRIRLHLDSERKAPPFSTTPQLTLLREQRSEKPTAERWPMTWTSADVLSADVPLSGGQTLLASLEVPGVGRTTMPPACLPYSAEFAPRVPGEGLRTLERLARATGGTERVDLASTWASLPKKPQLVSLAPWLLIAAIVLFLLEVLQRRTGMLSLRMPAFSFRRAQIPATGEPGTSPVGSPWPTTTARPKPVAGQPSPAPQAAPAATAPPPSKETVVDALSEARNRARQRTDR